jgi:small GTP-binding protein
MTEPHTYRIAVVGSGGVGKTCVILRFLRDTFDPDYIPTIQDSFDKTLVCQGKTARLTIIDTAGQDEMESITNLAVKSADAFIIIYSCTSSISFSEIERFTDKISRLASSSTSSCPSIVIAGNKCDMDEDRAVTTEQGRLKAMQMGASFFECSAKTNINVAPLFETSLKQLLGISSVETNPSGRKSPKQKGGCCSVA